MSERGQPKSLDDEKQQTVCSLVTAGVSVRQAAHFVGCDPKTIRREAARNRDFRQRLAKARSESTFHPLQTLRQAAKSNWRAALCWMERLEPQEFARPNARVITQREANRFAVDLAQSIERAVSNPCERKELWALVTAALPAAMRRRWEAIARRRGLADAMDALKAKRRATPVDSFFPWDLALRNDE